MKGNEIKGTHAHDAGAYGRCSYCGRYSDNPKCLIFPFYCECGRKDGFSGSFKKPDIDSKWSNPEDKSREAGK